MALARALPFIVALSAVLAGCALPLRPGASGGTATKASMLPTTWYEKALAHDGAHDHLNITQHQNLSTPNFHLLGHDPLLTDALHGKPAYNYGCGGAATRADGRRLDVVNAWQQDVTFVLVDVTDATKPTKIGEFYAKGMSSYDADITPDGKYVVLAFDQQVRAPSPTRASATASLVFTPACAVGTAAEAPIPIDIPEDTVVTAGIVMIDVSEPTHPKFADWDPLPGRNVHSVSTARIDNVTWVTGSVLGGVQRPPGFPKSTGAHALSYFVFDQVQDGKLLRVGQYDSPAATLDANGSPTVPVRNGHTDVALMKHPKSGTLLAYLADWEGGLLILDMTNPALPALLSQWIPPHEFRVNPDGDGPCYHSAIHEVLPAPVLWEGKHYLFAGQECPQKDPNRPGGQVFILDATDPARLNYVGEWHLPEDTGDKWTVTYQASPHYLALHERTLFIADYHAGLWAADVSTPELLKSPPSIGVYLATLPSPFPSTHNDTPLPMDEQVDVYPDGTITINDDDTGLYVLRFDANDPAPPAYPFTYPKA